MRGGTLTPTLTPLRGTAISFAAVGLVALAFTVQVAARAPNGTFVRDCRSAVYGDLGKNWRRDAIGARPLVFVGGKAFARWSRSSLAPMRGTTDRYQAQKVLVIVNSGAAVTVSVPAAERRSFALLYDPSQFKQSSYRVSDGEWKVTFHACRWQETGGFTPGFNGGFIVAGPRCVSLDVLVQGRVRSRLSLPLGIESSGCRRRG
jgi:hypothetical protein